MNRVKNDYFLKKKKPDKKDSYSLGKTMIASSETRFNFVFRLCITIYCDKRCFKN